MSDPHPHSFIARTMRSAAPPLAVFILFLLGWQATVTLFHLPAYELPAPSAVWEAAWENRRDLLMAMGLTASGALSGFVLSCLFGTLIAFLFAQSQLIRRSLFPYAIFLQTVPIIAIAPLVILWFGYGFPSVVVVAMILSLFPIITNGAAGLTALDPNLVEFFRLNRATRWQMLVKLRLPTAHPYFIAGARISSGLSVIGAIVGEFFAGLGTQFHGLGYLINYTNGQIQTAYLFAAIIASTLLGLAVFMLVSWIGNLWTIPSRSGPSA